MSAAEQYLEIEDLHPIDIVETLAEHHAWDFDRVAEDQIAMAVEGQWRTYSVTLAWSAVDETLRLIVTFEMEPPEESLPRLYEMLNQTNDMCWSGAFTYWQEQRLMVYRYGLVLAGGQVAGAEQLGRLLGSAIANCERFYPAFQLASWSDTPVEEAMQVAIAEAYGRA
ncbi:MAG: diacylglyceryl transferase [Alphaproteobacteria bacterium]|nr:MAG: diacylglyceryl transferase [Alphaproteobacteria bacterium]